MANDNVDLSSTNTTCIESLGTAGSYIRPVTVWLMRRQCQGQGNSGSCQQALNESRGVGGLMHNSVLEKDCFYVN